MFKAMKPESRPSRQMIRFSLNETTSAGDVKVLLLPLRSQLARFAARFPLN